MGFLRLEHRLLQEFKIRKLENVQVVVAVSGGLDSVALMVLLKNVAEALNLKLSLAHVHHGWIFGAQGEYRLKAWKFAQKLAQKYELPFYSNLIEAWPELKFLNEPETPLRSEEELRNFRYENLNKIAKDLNEAHGLETYLATAHTSNDQLETQLLQLIRGSGEWGVKAMTFRSEYHLRPLISCDRQELKNYLKEKHQDYLEDPSNESSDPFRNWLRNEWLQQLEMKRAGSMESLSRSLRIISETLSGDPKELSECIINVKSEWRIAYPIFLELSFENKKRALARFMRVKNMRNYGHNHVLEILKRLDTFEKELKFTLLKHVWTLDTEFIKASPDELRFSHN